MKWKDKLIEFLVTQLTNDIEWGNLVDKISKDNSIGLHLAVFTEPFLTLVIKGEKSIESRFSKSRISPFGKVSKGDVVVVKESGGYVTAVFVVGDVKYYTFLNPERIAEIESNYGQFIGTRHDNHFWETRSSAHFATIMEIRSLRRLNPFQIGKNDRTGWSTIKLGYGSTLFS